MATEVSLCKTVFVIDFLADCAFSSPLSVRNGDDSISADCEAWLLAPRYHSASEATSADRRTFLEASFFAFIQDVYCFFSTSRLCRISFETLVVNSYVYRLRISFVSDFTFFTKSFHGLQDITIWIRNTVWLPYRSKFMYRCINYAGVPWDVRKTWNSAKNCCDEFF